MNTYEVGKKNDFVGREREWGFLRQLGERHEACVLIVYGRRRVGKTELIEQFFRKRNLLKFEGVQTDPRLPSDEKLQYQIGNVLNQLSKYTEAPHIARLKYTAWADVFDLMSSFVEEGKWTLYFEEVQWLANYQAQFFAELKPIWDNKLRHNKELMLIFCGSSPSFIVNQLVSDKAFYNRSQEEIELKPFNLWEAMEFFGKEKSRQEVLLAYLTCGGIPEYLKRLKAKSSVYLSLCHQSFLPRSFFSIEKDKIFVNSLSANRNFEKIIQFLSQRKFSTREEIAAHLKIETGGSLTDLLTELEACSFIEKYTPPHLPDETIVARYCIADPYLQFFFKFIAPLEKAIRSGDYESTPVRPLEGEAFSKWLGFAFERFCRRSHRVLAKILGFEAVKYRSGAFFTRRDLKSKEGFQIDLLFIRADHVLTICEVKYYQGKVGSEVIQDMEKKISLLKKAYPKAEKSTFHKVLITINGADKSLLSRGYFDRIITLKDIFEKRYW